MILPTIKFSHWYEKLRTLYGPYQPGLKAILISIFFMPNLKSLSEEFQAYDTVWNDPDTGAHLYPLNPDGKHLVLTFYAARQVGLFTTIRPYNVYKQQWYAGKVGQDFEIFLEAKIPKSKLQIPKETEPQISGSSNKESLLPPYPAYSSGINKDNPIRNPGDQENKNPDDNDS